MKRLLSILMAAAMLLAMLPSVAFATGGEPYSLTVDFKNATVSGSSPYGVSMITGTGFTVVADESTVKTSAQTKVLNANVDASATTKKKILQVVTEKNAYFTYGDDSVAAPSSQFTIMVDMGEGAEAGLYDIAFTGGKWYPAADLHIFADGRYIGDYDTRWISDTDLSIYVGNEQVYKSVYLEPDENNQVKFMFAIKAGGYEKATKTVDGVSVGYVDGTKYYSEGRILLSELVITESEEPETAEAIELNIGREKYYMADTASFDGTAKDTNANPIVPNLKIIEKYSVDLDNTSPSAVQRCYTNLVQFQLRSGGYSRWPNSKTTKDMYTIKTVVPKAGYYTVSMQGYRWYAGSQFAIYTNGEYAGDYSCWSGKTSGDTATLAEAPDTLNTVYLPRGDVEISFRSRKAHYNTPNLVPYKIAFTPAEKPTVSAIENKVVVSGTEVDVTPELLAAVKAGDVINVKSRVKMNDGTYRYFGYTNAGAIPTDNNIVAVTSSNPEVVEVSNVVCVEAATASADTISQVIDPTTTTYTLTAKSSGTADITVTAIVDGNTTTSTTTINVPFTDGAEAVEETEVSFSALSESGGSVSPTGVQSVEIGKSVTVTATPNSGYEFAYWRNAAGVWLSGNATETFTVNTNTAVVAVYDKLEEDTTVPLHFYNGNGELIESKNVTKGASFGAEKITNPTLAGAIFEGWSVADNTLINALTRAVALYDDDKTTTYNVTVSSETVASGNYGDEVTVTGSDSFVCWKLGDNIVSYDKEYTFLIWGDITLTEVTEGETKSIPTVGIDKQGDNYFITYNVPESEYTFLEAGIVFGTTEGITVNSTDGSKAIAKKGTGHFTAKPAKAEHSVARGYVMFKDAAGNVRITYAD